MLEAAAKATNAATAIPAGVRGRHSSAQNIASSRYQGVLTPLSAISIGAAGNSTTATPSSARRPADRTWPALAWKTNKPQAAATTAPDTVRNRVTWGSGK